MPVVYICTTSPTLGHKAHEGPVIRPTQMLYHLSYLRQIPFKMVVLSHKWLYCFLALSPVHLGDCISLEGLPTLERTISETDETKCDLIIFGKSHLLGEENELQRPWMIISHLRTDAEFISIKSTIAPAKCLILFMNEADYSINKVKYVTEQFQFLKPTGVFYETKTELVDLMEDTEQLSLPFPIIFHLVNGMFHNLSVMIMELIFLSEYNHIICPSLSEHFALQVIDPLNSRVKRCPNGRELMIDANFPIIYFGGGPYVLRKPGKQVSLGHGSYMAAIEILGKKFGFNVTLRPARSVVGYMGNVSIHSKFVIYNNIVLKYFSTLNEGFKKGCSSGSWTCRL